MQHISHEQHQGGLHPEGSAYRGFCIQVGVCIQVGGLHRGGGECAYREFCIPVGGLPKVELSRHPLPELEKWAVHNLLECFLVFNKIAQSGGLKKKLFTLTYIKLLHHMCSGLRE